MRGDTKRTHDMLVEIGCRLGFHSATEVSFAVEGGSDHYAPRLDVLWSLPLTVDQRAALHSVRAAPPLVRQMLPVAAWEVEGSDASTKGMQANLANMRVFGAYLSFLAVRADTKDNLFERAVRLASTQSHYFGHRRSLVLDVAWVAELAEMKLTKAAAAVAAPKSSDGSGGTGAWTKSVTAELTRRGREAGFVVIPEFQAPTMGAGFTQSKIDLVWASPLPAGLAVFVQDVRRRNGLPSSADCALLPVLGFEVENAASKHGHGCLLNLASHAMSGVFVAGSSNAAKAAEAAKATYSRVHALATVTVHEEFVR
jgi:hypothetical protein